MNRYALVVLFTAVIGTALCGAQTQYALGTTTGKPTADGEVKTAEYPLTVDLPKAKLSLSRSADTLYAALSAETAGWVAVGFGARRMDGAAIYIGGVVGGKGEVKAQSGRGHSHSDADAKALSASAVKEAGGRTVMELALNGSLLIPKDSKTLDLIVAYGNGDSFSSMHAGNYSVRISLE
jgi:hypothetical protein